MKTKAKDLLRGDVCRMHLFGEIVSATPIPGSKLVKVRMALENQGGRNQCGVPAQHRDVPLNPLEFTDDGHTIEFLCKWNRSFHLTEWWTDRNGGGHDDDSPDRPVPSNREFVD
jgi:hypothetical protein